MKTMIAALFLLMAAPSHASSPWAGRLDLTTLPSVGAWQSLTSADQAVGISKRVFHLDNAGQPIVNLALFGGVKKTLLTDPSGAATPIGGLTLAVPGSTLDTLLGTKWGDAWVPKLKTGVLAAYDLTRIKTLHIAPSFIGIGAAWPFGS